MNDARGENVPNQTDLALKSRSGEPLGLELVLTKDFFGGDVQTFIRFAQRASESAIEGGVKVIW